MISVIQQGMNALSILHKENIVRFVYPSGDTYFFVIDSVAYFNTPALGLGGSFELGNPEEWTYKNENDWIYDIQPDDSPLHYQ